MLTRNAYDEACMGTETAGHGHLISGTAVTDGAMWGKETVMNKTVAGLPGGELMSGQPSCFKKASVPASLVHQASGEGRKERAWWWG